MKKKNIAVLTINELPTMTVKQIAKLSNWLSGKADEIADLTYRMKKPVEYSKKYTSRLIK